MRPLSNAGRLPARLPTAASSLVPAPHQSWPGALVGKPRGETGQRSCRKKREEESYRSVLLWEKGQARQERLGLPDHASNFHYGKTGHIDSAGKSSTDQSHPNSSLVLYFCLFCTQRGWKLIVGEGPHLHCTDLQRQSSKNNILGRVPGEGRWGFVVEKSWQPWLWSVKIFLHPLRIYWLVFTPCPLWRIIYSNTMLSGASDFSKVHSSLKQPLAPPKIQEKGQICLDCLPKSSLSFCFWKNRATYVCSNISLLTQQKCHI